MQPFVLMSGRVQHPCKDHCGPTGLLLKGQLLHGIGAHLQRPWQLVRPKGGRASV